MNVKVDNIRYLIVSFFVAIISILAGFATLKLSVLHQVMPIIWLPSGILTIYYLNYRKSTSLFIILFTYFVMKILYGFPILVSFFSSFPEVFAIWFTIKCIYYFKQRYQSTLHNQTDIIGIPLACFLGSLITAVFSTYGFNKIGLVHKKEVHDFIYFSFMSIFICRFNMIMLYREIQRIGLRFTDVIGPIILILLFPVFLNEVYFSAIGFILIVYIIPLLFKRPIGLFLINFALIFILTYLTYQNKGPFEYFTNNNAAASAQVFLLSLTIISVALKSMAKSVKKVSELMPIFGILIVSSVVFFFYFNAEIKTEKIEIKNIHDNFTSILTERINLYENNLKSMGSFYKSVPKLGHEDFKKYAESIKLIANYDEIDAFGIIKLDDNREVVDTLISPEISDVYLSIILKIDEIQRLFRISFTSEIPILSKRIQMSSIDATVNKSIVLMPIIDNEHLVGFSFCIIDNELFFSMNRLKNTLYSYEIFEGVGNEFDKMIYTSAANKSESRLFEVFSLANHVYTVIWKKSSSTIDYNVNLSYFYFFLLMLFSSFSILYLLNVKLQNNLIGEKNELLKSKAYDSEKRYSSIFNASTDGIAVFKDSELIDYNSPFNELFYPTLDTTLFSIFPSESKELIENELSKLTQEDHLNLDTKCRGIQKEFSAEVKIDKFYVNNNLYHLVTIVDISDRKALEKSLKDARDFALEASKAKSRFLSNMSHEIRTPLNGIIGILNLFLDKNENKNLNDEQLGNLKVAEYSANHLIHILNEILDYNKIESGKIVFENRPINIQDFVEKIIKIHTVIGDKKAIGVELVFDNSIPKYLVLDEVRNAQVLNNILSNAIKFTAHGKVQLILELVQLKNNQAEIRFEIKDNGIGIPDDKIDYIFHEFTQADENHTRKYGGTGLGLSICKKLVNLMGGDIFVKSKVGVGTSMSYQLSFPISNPVYQSSTDDKIDLQNFNYGDKKILVVEDNDVNLLVAKKYFEKLNIQIDIARDGIEALEKFQANHYHLIFMDLHMPRLDGILASEEIRKTNKKIPIIALSADSADEVSDKLLNGTLNEFLQKPFKVQDIVLILKKYA